MRKILIVLLVLFISGCSTTTSKQETTETEVVEPDSFEPTTTASKQQAYYVYPITDKNGNMVLPLNTDVCIITTDETKSDFMRKTFEDTIVFYHKLLDPSHEYEGINNLYTINNNYGKGPIEVDKELIDILDSALTLVELTNGFFNPTVGEVSDIWKNLFNQQHRNNDPKPEEIEKALTSIIPYEKIRDYIVIDKDNNTVTFKALENSLSKVEIDLGAYSKGYVLDKAYEALLKYKDGFLMSAGGSSIITYVEPTQEKLHWTIGVMNPNDGSSAFQLRLTSSTISTSGDEQLFFINENGIRRHHIINPFTGYPENNYRSITLVSNKGAGTLDALTSAIYNLSLENIDNVITNIENEKDMVILKALITDEDNERLELLYDEAFNDTLQEIDSFKISNVTVLK